MAFGNREDLIVAAGEYVLGTLSPEDKFEVERALPGNAELRTEIQWWERRLAVLGLRLPANAPRPMVWLDIQQRVKSSSVTALPARSVRAPRAVTAWTWLATAASVVLAVALWTERSKEPQVVSKTVAVPAQSFVALLEVPGSTMKWTVSVTPARNQVVVRASGEAPDSARDRDAELWVITDAGPVSLGVIPKSGEVRRGYQEGVAFESGKTLAVSLEPKGGSTTGQPTGPVVTTATILQAG